mgnify:CR=1 FL=1
MTIHVCIAGASGWAGSALAAAVHQAEDMTLVGAVSRSNKGKVMEDVLGISGCHLSVSGSVEEALATPCDVMVEYTQPDVAKSHILAALSADAHVVVGTSGLTDADYAEIDAVAQERQRGVLAVGNFALTVVLMQKFAEIAARYIPQWEIFDYAKDDKIDAPSGTARELAHRLSTVRTPELTVPLKDIHGAVAARGASLAGSQIHSVRLPGYTLSAEVVFGLPDQKLIIRHDAGGSAQPYVDGALLAIRKVNTVVGLRRGLDHVMDLG